jgi:hypothetical protein
MTLFESITNIISVMVMTWEIAVTVRKVQ